MLPSRSCWCYLADSWVHQTGLWGQDIPPHTWVGMKPWAGGVLCSGQAGGHHRDLLLSAAWEVRSVHESVLLVFWVVLEESRFLGLLNGFGCHWASIIHKKSLETFLPEPWVSTLLLQGLVWTLLCSLSLLPSFLCASPFWHQKCLWCWSNSTVLAFNILTVHICYSSIPRPSASLESKELSPWDFPAGDFLSFPGPVLDE